MTAVLLMVGAALPGFPAAAAGASGRPEARLPHSMAAIGDSISLAFNTHAGNAAVPFPPDPTVCPDGFGGLTGFPFDCPPNSWTTGTNPAVDSVAQRLVQVSPALAGNVANYAVSGVKAAGLPAQATQAAGQGAAFVTVDIGVNDACTATPDLETSLSTFRTQFQQAMTTLAASPARPDIEVLSIPNVYREWQLFHNDPNAQFRWQLAGICQVMFANPTSTAFPDIARRLLVLGRILAYNLIEADVCVHTPRCRTDGGAVFAWQFAPQDISTVANTGSISNVPALANFPVFGPGIPNSTGDYFHPSLLGQAALASLAWDRSPWPIAG